VGKERGREDEASLPAHQSSEDKFSTEFEQARPVVRGDLTEIGIVEARSTPWQLVWLNVLKDSKRSSNLISCEKWFKDA